MHLRPILKITAIPFLLLLKGCITPFVPPTNEDLKLLIVEGLITDQPDTNTVKLSRSLPLGKVSRVEPVTGCIITVSDNLGNTSYFWEKVAGTYVTSPSEFQGVVGRFYTLHINTKNGYNNLNYESYPLELKPVPAIDSIYYEKVKIDKPAGAVSEADGCRIYLNSSDPDKKCRFYRWDFTETWEFQLPYPVENWRCWLSDNSKSINIKSTSVLGEYRIVRHPLTYISNESDRLKVKYSILANQYSLNEDEFVYWEKLSNITQNIGTIYDIIPAGVQGNIYCIENPEETVLGYFSVSAKKSKRIFIKDRFSGLVNPYSYDICFGDTIFGNAYIPNLNTTVWKLIDNTPFYIVITRNRGCADCTVRGTKVEPDFWNQFR
jgi:hypothetical protein